MRSTLVCTALLLLAGCSAHPRAGRALPEHPPADFGLAVTVLPADDDAARARYIVEPDGTLRAATGAGATVQTFPAAVRLLDQAQRRRLWWLTLDTRAHDPTSPWALVAPDTFDPLGQSVTIVTTSFWGARTSAAIPPGEEASPAAQALAEELARLAWISP